MAKKYKAFISYRHLLPDMKVAGRLHKMIERYVIPRDLRKEKGKRLGMVFRNKEELPLTSDLTGDIFEALDNSEYLIVVCTPETPKSKWVQREIEHFISVHGRERVFVVLAGGTVQKSVPERIYNVYAEDGVTIVDQIEPLVAFVVDDKPSKIMRHLRKEFLRLIAAMLNVPYDSLYQRNKRYRMQRFAIVMAIVLAFAIAFIGSLASKNHEISLKNEEIAQKNVQIQEQLLATQLSESYSMAQVSLQELEAGNQNAAIRTAMAVLPSEGNERPYCADAQFALTQALHAYESNAVYPVGHIRQSTQIEDIAVSPNDRYAVTLDNVGALRGYDLRTLKLLWEKAGSYSPLTSIRALEPSDCGLFTTDARDAYEGGGLIFYSDYDNYRCIDAATGEVLSETMAGVAPSPDGSMTATFVSGSEDRPQKDLYTYDFILYDTTSGEVVETKTLPFDTWMTSAEATALSADHKRLLVVTNPYTQEPDTGVLSYSLYDLETCERMSMQSRTYEEKYPKATWGYSAAGAMAIVQVEGESFFSYAAISLSDGSIAWEYTFPIDPEKLAYVGMFSLEDGSTLLFSHVYLGAKTENKNSIHCVRLAADGSVLMEDARVYDGGFNVTDEAAYRLGDEVHFFSYGEMVPVDINQGIRHPNTLYHYFVDEEGYRTRLTEGAIFPGSDRSMA